MQTFFMRVDLLYITYCYAFSFIEEDSLFFYFSASVLTTQDSFPQSIRFPILWKEDTGIKGVTF